MMRLTRRHSRLVALLLLAVHLPGSRVHARTDACGHTKVFHGPARPFKALARAVTAKVTHVKFEKKAPRSFGASRNRTSSCELAGLRGAPKLSAVTILPDTCVTLAAAPLLAHPESLRPLPCDLSPSPPLHTRN
jgi:hypothetical protein